MQSIDFHALTNQELFAVAGFFDILRNGKFHRAGSIITKLHHHASKENAAYMSTVLYGFQVLKELQARQHICKGDRLLLVQEYVKALKEYNRVRIDRVESLDSDLIAQYQGNRALAQLAAGQRAEGLATLRSTSCSLPSTQINLVFALISCSQHREALHLVKDIKNTLKGTANQLDVLYICDVCMVLCLTKLDRLIEAEAAFHRLPALMPDSELDIQQLKDMACALIAAHRAHFVEMANGGDSSGPAVSPLKPIPQPLQPAPEGAGAVPGPAGAGAFLAPVRRLVKDYIRWNGLFGGNQYEPVSMDGAMGEESTPLETTTVPVSVPAVPVATAPVSSTAGPKPIIPRPMIPAVPAVAPPKPTSMLRVVQAQAQQQAESKQLVRADHHTASRPAGGHRPTLHKPLPKAANSDDLTSRVTVSGANCKPSRHQYRPTKLAALLSIDTDTPDVPSISSLNKQCRSAGSSACPRRFVEEEHSELSPLLRTAAPRGRTMVEHRKTTSLVHEQLGILRFASTYLDAAGQPRPHHVTADSIDSSRNPFEPPEQVKVPANSVVSGDSSDHMGQPASPLMQPGACMVNRPSAPAAKAPMRSIDTRTAPQKAHPVHGIDLTCNTEDTVRWPEQLPTPEHAPPVLPPHSPLSFPQAPSAPVRDQVAMLEPFSPPVPTLPADDFKVLADLLDLPSPAMASPQKSTHSRRSESVTSPLLCGGKQRCLTQTTPIYSSSPSPSLTFDSPSSSKFVSSYSPQPVLQRERAYYPHDRLKAPGPYPEDVDIALREQHLSDEDFIKVMGTDKRSFMNMPAWKQLSKKKSAGLF